MQRPAPQRVTGLFKPLLAFACAAASVAIVAANSSLLGCPNALTPRPLKRWAGGALATYTAVLLVARLRQQGTITFLHFVWACNMAMVTGAGALWVGADHVVAACAISVAIDQLMWFVDCAGYITTGRWPVGVAAYLSWPTTPAATKLTSTHHLWFLPLCLLSMDHPAALAPPSFALSVAINAALAISARAMVPFQALDARGQLHYMNVNLTHECWRDVKVPALHWGDHRRWFLALPFLMLVWNTLNAPCWLLLRSMYEARLAWVA